MLHIILAILKIVGILLAAILLLVLLAVCSVLFVPLRYRVSAAKDAGGLRACGRITWLLRLVSVSAEYSGGKPSLNVRILFLKKNLLSGGGDFPEEQKSERKPPGRAKKKEKPEAAKKTVEKGVESPGHAQQAEAVQEPPEREEKPQQPAGENKKAEKASVLKSVLGRIRAVFRRIKEFWERLKGIPERIRRFLGRGKASVRKIRDWLSFLRSDMVKAVFGRFRQHFIYLWKHLKPDSVWGEVNYGFEDPSLTGQLTGVLYLLLPAGCYDVRLNPDFENPVCEGEIHLKGHIRICHLARVGWKVFRDKEFRKILKKIKYL